MTTKTFSFTKNEVEILCDRLEVGECIAECLVDDLWRIDPEKTDEELAAFFEKVELVAERLLDEVEKTGAVRVTSVLERDVLRDAAAGSTFLAKAEDAGICGELSHQKVAAFRRAATSLGKKLGVEVPQW